MEQMSREGQCKSVNCFIGCSRDDAKIVQLPVQQRGTVRGDLNRNQSGSVVDKNTFTKLCQSDENSINLSEKWASTQNCGSHVQLTRASGTEID